MSREVVAYISVWDGSTEVETTALYNTETKEVYDIVESDAVEEIETLDEQYILFRGEKRKVEWDEEKKGFFTV